MSFNVVRNVGLHIHYLAAAAAADYVALLIIITLSPAVMGQLSSQ